MQINLTLEPTTEDLQTLTNNINDEAAIRGMTAKAYPFAFFASILAPL